MIKLPVPRQRPRSTCLRASLSLLLLLTIETGCGSSENGSDDNLEGATLSAKVYECTPDARTLAEGGESVPELVRVVPTPSKKAIIEIERFLDTEVEENVPFTDARPSVTLTGRNYKVAINTALEQRSANGIATHPASIVHDNRSVPLSCRPFDDRTWFYEKVRLSARIAGQRPHALPAKIELLAPAFQAKVRAANAAIDADIRRRGLHPGSENRFFSVEYTHERTVSGAAGFALWALQPIDPAEPRTAMNMLTWTIAFDTTGKEMLRVMAAHPE